MGPLSLATRISSSGQGSGDLTGFLLWTAGAGNYLTINAAGDNILINLQ